MEPTQLVSETGTPLHMSEFRAVSHRLFVALGLSLATGCFGGSKVPELAEVTGTVKLDGQPLPQATVTFSPQVQDGQEGRPSTGATDESGEYSLHYSTTESGARPGQYRVSISTFRPAGEDKDGNEVDGTPETVPSVYNSQTTLTADVKLDGPPIDFELKSDAGPVIQPSGGAEDAPSRSSDGC
jgi:hypothetical protein